MNKLRTNSKGTAARARALRYKALKLRQDGKSYRDIGRHLDITHTTAYKYVMKCIAELDKKCAEEAEVVRTISLQRLDRAMDAIRDKVKAGDLAAINTMLRIEERRTKFLGIDMPVKQKVELSSPEDEAIKIEFVK